MEAMMERYGWTRVEDFRGLRRDRVVAHSKIRRPDAAGYHGGYDAEGYSSADALIGLTGKTAKRARSDG
jgi:hypothetical protein